MIYQACTFKNIVSERTMKTWLPVSIITKVNEVIMLVISLFNVKSCLAVKKRRVVGILLVPFVYLTYLAIFFC